MKRFSSRTWLACASIWLLAAPASAAGAPTKPALAPGCAKPVYPREALRQEQAGTVLVAFQIGGDGKVTASRVDKSSGFPLLDEAAREGLARCVFKAPKDKDKAAWIQVAYVWALDGPPSAPVDPKVALARVIAGEAKGDPFATTALGMRYLNGKGVDLDLARGRRLLQKGGELGEAMGYHLLAFSYRGGGDEPRDMVAVERWLRAAAVMDWGPSQAELGRLLIRGDGVTPRPAEGMDWLRKSAAQGTPAGQAFLGEELLAQAGEDAAARDRQREGVEWLLKAAHQGHRDAQARVGALYRYGTAVEQDYGKAEEWLRKASKGGHSNAWQALESMYKSGQATRPAPADGKAG